MAKAYKKSVKPNFARVARRLKSEAPEVLRRNVREFSEEEKQEFKDKILGQDFPSFIENPLSEQYKERKRQHGADTRVMVATQHYVDSIRVFEKQEGGGKVSIYVGFSPQDRAKDLDGNLTNTQLVKVAAYHEYGGVINEETGARLPARPHWGPHFKAMKERAPQIRKQVQQQLKSYIQQVIEASS